MSFRQAARGIAGRLGQQAANGAQHQQRRLVGDLPAKPNRFIEDWSTRREHIENEFRWNTRTLVNIALFAGVAPYLVYIGGVAEFNHVDEKAGRFKRDMWGSSSEK